MVNQMRAKGGQRVKCIPVSIITTYCFVLIICNVFTHYLWLFVQLIGCVPLQKFVVNITSSGPSAFNRARVI